MEKNGRNNLYAIFFRARFFHILKTAIKYVSTGFVGHMTFLWGREYLSNWTPIGSTTEISGLLPLQQASNLYLLMD